MANYKPKSRALFIVTTETGCMVPISHKVNTTGYITKRWGWGKDCIAEQLHRFIYRAHHGEHSLPKGWEVDHICRNRACCNPRHLRALSKTDHARSSNITRHETMIEQARCYWLAHSKSITGQALADAFDVGKSTASRWLQAWKSEEAEDAKRWGLFAGTLSGDTVTRYDARGDRQ